MSPRRSPLDQGADYYLAQAEKMEGFAKRLQGPLAERFWTAAREWRRRALSRQ